MSTPTDARGKIYDDVTQTIGNTPLVRLNRLTKGLNATVLVTGEFFMPLSSVKDDGRKVGFEAARLLDELMADPGRRQALPPLLIPPRGIAVRRSTEVSAVDDPLIALAMRHVREHACNGLRVPDLLAKFNVSRSVLYRRFHDALNRSPHEEILRVQLERAKRLLEESAFTLKRIAELSGFQHGEYLSVAFKRELGLTPSEYRRQQRL